MSAPVTDTTSDLPPTEEPPTPPAPEEPSGPVGGDVPVEPPPTTPDPTPEAPDPADTIHWEPNTWYAITYACLTPGCKEENKVKSAPLFPSNNGDPKYIRVNCAADGCCKKDCKILTATKLDPQPIEE